ncbi:uncharacterized protein LOC135119466 [Zophobas morio]|uniref:uncharacterized protein LOC135119466 n=1 Tax=Zophobas morio TaxID=2755281 RepID=UPI003083B9C6
MQSKQLSRQYQQQAQQAQQQQQQRQLTNQLRLQSPKLLKVQEVKHENLVIIKIIKLEIDITILKERFEQLSIEKRTIEENATRLQSEAQKTIVFITTDVQLVKESFQQTIIAQRTLKERIDVFQISVSSLSDSIIKLTSERDAEAGECKTLRGRIANLKIELEKQSGIIENSNHKLHSYANSFKNALQFTRILKVQIDNLRKDHLCLVQEFYHAIRGLEGWCKRFMEKNKNKWKENFNLYEIPISFLGLISCLFTIIPLDLN